MLSRLNHGIEAARTASGESRSSSSEPQHTVRAPPQSEAPNRRFASRYHSSPLTCPWLSRSFGNDYKGVKRMHVPRLSLQIKPSRQLAIALILLHSAAIACVVWF